MASRRKKAPKKGVGKGKGKASETGGEAAAGGPVLIEREVRDRAMALLDEHFGSTIIRHDPQRPVLIVNPVPGQAVIVVTDDAASVSVVNPAALSGV